METDVDYTNPDSFIGYLSGFWTQVFQGSEAVRGLVDGQSAQLSQLALDFAGLVRSASLEGMPAWTQENVRPIFLRRSTMGLGPDEVTFGEGANYGPQVTGSPLVLGSTPAYGDPQRRATPFYHVVPAELAAFGATLANRLYDPSVIWVAGADFFFDAPSSTLSFREDPFANPLFARRVVAAPDGTPDEEIVLFAAGVQVERGDLHARYGYPFFSQPPLGGDIYQFLLQAIFNLYSGGATVRALDSFFAALTGSPVIREAQETVVGLYSHGPQSLVVTDRQVYALPAGQNVRPEILVGSVLSAGQPLGDGCAVFDHQSSPYWWNQLETLAIREDFCGRDLVPDLSRSLGFPNTGVTVDPGSGIPLLGGTRHAGRFALAGLPADVDAFWAAVRSRSISQNHFMADALWTRAGLVHGDGSPDFSQSLSLNPLGFLFEELLGQGIVAVRMTVAPSPAFLRALALLRDALPVTRALLVFPSPGVAEDLTVSGAGNLTVDPFRANCTDLSIILASGNYTDSTQPVSSSTWAGDDFLADGLGTEIAPQLLIETLDLSDVSLLKHTVRSIYIPLCS